jgi:hypothetical protein
MKRQAAWLLIIQIILKAMPYLRRQCYIFTTKTIPITYELHTLYREHDMLTVRNNPVPTPTHTQPQSDCESRCRLCRLVAQYKRYRILLSSSVRGQSLFHYMYQLLEYQKIFPFFIDYVHEFYTILVINSNYFNRQH